MSSAATDPSLFDLAEWHQNPGIRKGLREAILELISRRRPSAWKLCQGLEERFGLRVYWFIRDMLEELAEEKSLPGEHRDYLRSLLDSEDLVKAIRGTEPPRKAIESSIDALIHQGRGYRESRTFREMISFMARFKDYSPFNNMLVKVQNPACGFFATQKDWYRKHKRYLVEDARPMVILAPMHPVLLVYDLDQTCGPDLPKHLLEFAQFSGSFDPQWLSRMVENAEKRNRIQVRFKEQSSSMGGFATNQVQDPNFKMRIVVHAGLDDPSRFGVLCHELAHILLGHLGMDKDNWWPSRRDLPHSSVEIEAEAVAYLVTTRLGLSGASPQYVSNHLRGEVDIPDSVSLDLIAKVAGQIEEMALHLLPPRRPKSAKSGTTS